MTSVEVTTMLLFLCVQMQQVDPAVYAITLSNHSLSCHEVPVDPGNAVRLASEGTQQRPS